MLGWGIYVLFSGQLSTRLQKRELSEIALRDCNEIYKKISDTDLKDSKLSPPPPSPSPSPPPSSLLND